MIFPDAPADIRGSRLNHSVLAGRIKGSKARCQAWHDRVNHVYWPLSETDIVFFQWATDRYVKLVSLLKGWKPTPRGQSATFLSRYKNVKCESRCYHCGLYFVRVTNSPIITCRVCRSRLASRHTPQSLCGVRGEV